MLPYLAVTCSSTCVNPLILSNMASSHSRTEIYRHSSESVILIEIDGGFLKFRKFFPISLNWIWMKLGYDLMFQWHRIIMSWTISNDASSSLRLYSHSMDIGLRVPFHHFFFFEMFFLHLILSLFKWKTAYMVGSFLL